MTKLSALIHLGEGQWSGDIGYNALTGAYRLLTGNVSDKWKVLSYMLVNYEGEVKMPEGPKVDQVTACICLEIRGYTPRQISDYLEAQGA